MAGTCVSRFPPQGERRHVYGKCQYQRNGTVFPCSLKPWTVSGTAQRTPAVMQERRSAQSSRSKVCLLINEPFFLGHGALSGARKWLPDFSLLMSCDKPDKGAGWRRVRGAINKGPRKHGLSVLLLPPWTSSQCISLKRVFLLHTMGRPQHIEFKCLIMHMA